MYTKVSLLAAYISYQKFHIICLSETNLNSKALSVDDGKYMDKILLEKITHLTISKRESTYYQNLLLLKTITVKYLQESISFEFRVSNKCCKFICLHRSPSQIPYKFKTFSENFELTLDKIEENKLFMTIVLGDLFGKSKRWFKNDTTSLKDFMIDVVTSTCGLSQLIQEPTHILKGAISGLRQFLASESP